MIAHPAKPHPDRRPLQPTPAGGTWTASGTFASVKMDISYTK